MRNATRHDPAVRLDRHGVSLVAVPVEICDNSPLVAERLVDRSVGIETPDGEVRVSVPRGTTDHHNLPVRLSGRRVGVVVVAEEIHQCHTAIAERIVDAAAQRVSS